MLADRELDLKRRNDWYQCTGVVPVGDHGSGFDSLAFVHIHDMHRDPEAPVEQTPNYLSDVRPVFA